MAKFNISDSVIARIAQLLQEAIMLGTDVVDHLRAIELELPEGSTKAELTKEYVEAVEREYTRLLDRAEELKAASLTPAGDA